MSKSNGHGGIRSRSDVSATQTALLREVEAHFPDAFWWGVPGRPVNRLYLSRNFGLATYIDFEDGATLRVPRFGTSNVRDEAQRHELAQKALPAFRAALVLGPDPSEAEQLDREVALAETTGREFTR